MRIDRWLWAVRLFKTRGEAAQACRGGKVRIGQDKVKASRPVRRGDRLEVVKDGIQREIHVLDLLFRRVGAKLVPDYMEDLTPEDRFPKRDETLAQAILLRDARTGRPTKRDRREIRRLFGDY